MDREDRRRFFIVGSVVVEIVNPVFRQRLKTDIKNRGFSSFQDFLNSQPVIHILFHLRHRNTWCCTDKSNCTHNHCLPLFKCQWKILYTEKPTLPGYKHRTCHCKFTAKPVTVEDLDINLAGLILHNCCILTQRDKYVIDALRQYKNDHVSHNLDGTITEDEYDSIWTNMSSCILHLDATKKDDLVRIEKRPLDDALCRKYTVDLLEIHQKLDQMDASIKEMHADIQVIQGMKTDIQEILYLARKGAQCQCYKDQIQTVKDSIQQYRLGQDIFTLHHQLDLTDLLQNGVRNTRRKQGIMNGVMMDDGRLVLVIAGSCLDLSCEHGTLLIYRTNKSSEESIPLQYEPLDVTAVNNTTVAVTGLYSKCIEMYDINSKDKLKSIKVPGMSVYSEITTLNNKLVVCGYRCLLIIDPHTGNTIKTIHIVCDPLSLHAKNDNIFYCNHPTSNDKKLYCYNYSSNNFSRVTLPCLPRGITSLCDGSLYVVCYDKSVYHVSHDVQHYNTITTVGLGSVGDCNVISYNPKQRKLITCTWEGLVKVFNEL